MYTQTLPSIDQVSKSIYQLLLQYGYLKCDFPQAIQYLGSISNNVNYSSCI